MNLNAPGWYTIQRIPTFRTFDHAPNSIIGRIALREVAVEYDSLLRRISYFSWDYPNDTSITLNFYFDNDSLTDSIYDENHSFRTMDRLFYDASGKESSGSRAFVIKGNPDYSAYSSWKNEYDAAGHLIHKHKLKYGLDPLWLTPLLDDPDCEFHYRFETRDDYETQETLFITKSKGAIPPLEKTETIEHWLDAKGRIVKSVKKETGRTVTQTYEWDRRDRYYRYTYESAEPTYIYSTARHADFFRNGRVIRWWWVRSDEKYMEQVKYLDENGRVFCEDELEPNASGKFWFSRLLYAFDDNGLISSVESWFSERETDSINPNHALEKNKCIATKKINTFRQLRSYLNGDFLSRPDINRNVGTSNASSSVISFPPIA